MGRQKRLQINGLPFWSGCMSGPGQWRRCFRHALSAMRKKTVLLLVLALASPLLHAFDRSDGVQVACIVERHGERRTVQEVWLGHGDAGDRHPELGGAAAVVRPDEQGWPVISFDRVTIRSIRANDPHMLDFIFYHECAHATDPERDEIEANCEAFLTLDRLGMMNEELERALARTHRKMLRLPSRYGGSGSAFWDKTMACVNARRTPADQISVPDGNAEPAAMAAPSPS